MAFDWNPSAGKGGHGKLRVGGGRTIVKSGELRPLDIERMLKQLGLPKDALK